MLISIIIKLTINLICDIIILASVYNCVSSPTVNAQFIELTTNENRLKWRNLNMNMMNIISWSVEMELNRIENT